MDGVVLDSTPSEFCSDDVQIETQEFGTRPTTDVSSSTTPHDKYYFEDFHGKGITLDF